MLAQDGGPRLPIGLGLLLMSFGSGCMDILSYRSLGEVFPSAMTGNAALMGLSLGQGNLLAAAGNLCALGSFFSGLLIGGALLRGTPGRLRFVGTLGLQAGVLLGFMLAWEAQRRGLGRYGLIGLGAVGMGVQSAVAHRIGVTGVSTTYFTGTLANIAFGLVAPGTQARRRVAWPALAFSSYVSGAAMAGWSKFAWTLPAVPLAMTVLLGIIIAVAGPTAKRNA